MMNINQHELASVVYNFFHKKLLVVLLKVKLCQTKNYLKNCTSQLLENLKIEKYALLLTNIWSADLVDMQLISKFYKGFWFSFTANIHAPLKGKKGITITNAFQKSLDVSNCKTKKIWADKGGEFCNG